MPETNNKKKKSERGVIVEVCPELVQIFQKISKNVEDYTWGAQKRLSNLACSRILCQRIKKANIY